MYSWRTSDDRRLVRCLDCGTVYEQPDERDRATECPSCGYVGWIVLRDEDAAGSRRSS